MSIMSRGRRSPMSLRTVSANSNRLSYVSRSGFGLYRKSIPYSLAAVLVTFGFRKTCLSGIAMKWNTAATGQLSTRVFRRGSFPRSNLSTDP